MTSNSFRKRILVLSPAQRKMLVDQLNNSVENKDQQKEPQRLVAYVAGDENLDLATVLQYAREQLPDYMVPVTMVKLTDLPRLPNGKLDLNALTCPDEDEDEASGYVPPDKLIEQQLAKIWEEVLGVQPVGIHDNFFEIGGDSILSIQIVARARKAGLELTPKQVFEYQTIAELALDVRSIDKVPKIQTLPRRIVDDK